MSNLVSVVIPVYNSARFVVEAIESAFRQTHKNLQLVVINDGSTDESDSVIKNFLPNERLNYIVQKNQGPSATRNCGIKKCDGEYVAFLDSDDVWQSDKIEKQLFHLKSSDADIVYTGRDDIDEKGNIIKNGTKRHFYSGYILNEIYVDNFICMSSALLKKNVFHKIGMLNEALKMSEDYEFWLRAALQCKFSFVDEALVKYRIHNGQSSNRCLERLEVIGKIYNDLEPALALHLNRHTINKSKALHYCNWGYYYRSLGEKRVALSMYIKALKLTPYNIRILKYMLGALR